MSKIVKGITKPIGKVLGLGGGGGGGGGGAESLRGSGREQFVSAATSSGLRHFDPGKESWSEYVTATNKAHTARNQPEPMTFEMPSFQFPDFSSMFGRPADAGAKPPAAKTVAERLKEEAEQFGKVKAGERVFSAAQGVSTRLRAAASNEEDQSGGTLGEAAGTILGNRGTGGATSFRRKRISRY